MDLDSIPIIERQCKHNSKKVITREIDEGYFITSIDLCSKCKDSLEFSNNLKFVDKKVKPKSKSLTSFEIKKAIIKRKKEIELLKQENNDIWKISDVLTKTPKLLEYYIALEILHDELETLYEKYIKKISN